jgi:dienelactone hydrolase
MIVLWSTGDMLNLGFTMLETMAERYHKLEAFTEMFGPKDNIPRPAMIIFHGCGGVRPHIYLYAETAAISGIRVFVVDSLKMRGWGRTQAISLVCTGIALQGYERSGDVLAALWGISNREDVISDQIILAGFSHGGWSIMDLMTQPLVKSGEARLKDPDANLIARVKGVFMVYPYISFPARSVRQTWKHFPKTSVVLAKKDHLTSYAQSIRVFERLRTQGLEVHITSLNASHAFDEETFGKAGIMHYDEGAVKTSLESMLSFIDEVFNLPHADVKVSKAKAG